MAKKAFNPVEYKQDFMNLAQSAPHEAADVAMKWRERFVNQAEQMRKGSQQLAEVGVAGGTAWVAGMLDGTWEAKRDAMIRDWEESGHIEAEADLEEHPTPFSHAEGGNDPTKIFNLVDRMLIITLVLAGIGVTNIFGKKASPYFRSAALGTGATWASGWGRSFGYKRKAKKLTEAEDEAEAA